MTYLKQTGNSLTRRPLAVVVRARHTLIAWYALQFPDGERAHKQLAS
jgi:hypothetical protein